MMAENEKNLTVWQRLSQTFGPNSLLGQDIPTYQYDKKVLLRTTDKDEYEKQKLQARQTYYLSQQWAKIENNLYSSCKNGKCAVDRKCEKIANFNDCGGRGALYFYLGA